MAEETAVALKKELPPLSFYLNVDIGYKVAVSDKAPEGPYADFRFGLNKSFYEFAGENGLLTAEFGIWDHSPINQMNTTKIRWWLGIGYNNPDWLGFFITPRVYAGVVPDNQIGMIAIAGTVGIKPILYQDWFGLEASYFGVFHEKYYNVPQVEGEPMLDTAQFHIGTLAPFFKFNKDLVIKLHAQLWYIKMNMNDGPDPNATLHMQFGGGLISMF